MIKSFSKITILSLVAVFFVNCPDDKKDDNTALVALLALSGNNPTCDVTASSVNLGAIPLNTATSTSLNVALRTRVIGTQTMAVVSAKGLTAGKRINIGGSTTQPTIYRQSECPLNTSQNSAILTTDYTVSQGSVSWNFTINTPGDYLIFVNTASLTRDILDAGIL
ncbi:LIC20153 family lipoprotein [Leptospira jelokensis]|uniref:LIC20153 family lipoprotein n=1 Tax=Leptospira jelokensis TaxID=2484931 RepID=UPI0010912848|nr:hypothetical protein [Leptospira jelokensis]TGM06655.1 hypothetical protein EHQ79_01495 [Leptospira jelokensis]